MYSVELQSQAQYPYLPGIKKKKLISIITHLKSPGDKNSV